MDGNLATDDAESSQNTSTDKCETVQLDAIASSSSVKVLTYVPVLQDSAADVDVNDESKDIVPMANLECVAPEVADGSRMQVQEVQAVTLEDGSTILVEQQQNEQQEQEQQQQQQHSESHETRNEEPQSDQLLREGMLCTATYIENDDTDGATVRVQLPKFVDGQAIQLEDGSTAYIHSTPREGVHAVQLEDGTMAYIASNPPPDDLYDLQEDEDDNLDNPTDGYKKCRSDAKLKTSVLTSRPMTTMKRTSQRAVELGDKAFRCYYTGCDRLYTTQHHLKVHERSHTGDRPFRCEFAGCNKSFATGYGLKSHTRVHTGEKPYLCPQESCDKAFKTSGDLQKHVRTHTGEKPFKCPFEGCDRSFTTSNIRKVHVRTHTGERPYTCTEESCGRSFASATNYKNHIRIHTGEKPYVCGIHGCGKRFTEYSSLYKHHVVHTHAKPYLCSFCGKNYRQISTLTIHRRTVHGIVDDTVDEILARAMEATRSDEEEREDDDDDENDLDAHETTETQLKPSSTKLQPHIQVMVSGDEIITDPNTIVTFQTTTAAGGEQQLHLVQATAMSTAPQIFLLAGSTAQFLTIQPLDQQQLVAASEAMEITEVTLEEPATAQSEVDDAPMTDETIQKN